MSVLRSTLVLVASSALLACGASRPAGGARDPALGETDNGNGVPATCALVRVVRIPERVLTLVTPAEPVARAAWAAAHVAAIDAEVERTSFRLRLPEDEVLAAHVFFEVPEGADAATRASARTRAEAILARARAGEPIDALAREATDDFLAWDEPIDWFVRGQMIAPFEEACFSMDAPGIVPYVVESPYGYHVVAVLGRRAAGELSPSDLRAEAIDDLYESERATLGRARLESALAEARSGHTTLDATLDAFFGRLRTQLEDSTSDPIRGAADVLHSGAGGQYVEAAQVGSVLALEPGELLPALVPDDDAVVIVAGGSRPVLSAPECALVAHTADEDLLHVLREASRRN